MFSIVSKAYFASNVGDILKQIRKLVRVLKTFPAYLNWGMPSAPVTDISASQQLFKYI